MPKIKWTFGVGRNMKKREIESAIRKRVRMAKKNNDAIKIEPLDGYVYGVKFTPEQVCALAKAIDDIKKEIRAMLILDMDELVDKIIRVEYPTYENADPYMQSLINRKKTAIKMILKQYIEEILGE